MPSQAIAEQNNSNAPYELTEGVKYIKISKFDQDGFDRTYQLQNLESLTLDIQGGTSTNYVINNKVEEDNYFLFYIDNVLYDTTLTSSDDSYVRYNYNLEIEEPSILYKVFNSQGQNTSSVFINAFKPLTEPTIDTNGSEQEGYWNNPININVLPNRRFYWRNTPSIPMEYSASITLSSTQPSFSPDIADVVLFKISDTAIFPPPPNVVAPLGVPQTFDGNSIIQGKYKIETNGGIQQEGDIISSSIQFTLSQTPQTITIYGVDDAVTNDSVGFAFKITPTSFQWDFNRITAEDISLSIKPHYIIGENTNAGPSVGGESYMASFPNITVDNPLQLDVYQVSDYNPILNNATLLLSSNHFQVSNREIGNINPSNIDKIIKGIAESAEVQDYYYDIKSSLNPKYDGCKNQSSDFNRPTKQGIGKPPAEKNSIYFTNCLGAGGQSPEYIDKTFFYITKLIDENGNVFDCKDKTKPQYIDFKYTFGKDDLVDVNINAANPDFIGYDGLSGTHKILSVGTLKTLIITGQGQGGNDYVNALDFTAQEGSEEEGLTDYRLITYLSADETLSTGAFPYLINFDNVTFSGSENLGFLYSVNDTNLAGRYKFQEATGDIAVTIETSVTITNERVTPTGPSYDEVTVKILKGGTTVLAEETVELATEYFNLETGTVAGESHTFNLVTSANNYDNSPTDYIEVKIFGNNSTNKKIHSNAELKVIQNPSPSNTTEDPIYLNITPNLGELAINDGNWVYFNDELSNSYGLIQNLSQSQVEFGYSPGNLIPFIPQPGDEIRFGYTEDNKALITRVIPPGEYDTKLWMQLDRTFNIGALNTGRNHFLIRRFLDDNSGFTLDIKKEYANSGDGTTQASFISPLNVTTKLKTSISDIVRNLTNEGIF